MSSHNICFWQKYEKYQNFYLKTFSFLVVKFSIYLNRHVFIMSVIVKNTLSNWSVAVDFHFVVLTKTG